MTKRPYYVAFLCLYLAGCSAYYTDTQCPPPPSARAPLTQTYACDSPTVTPYQYDPQRVHSLAELVDLALENSPKTRATWYRAKAVATKLGTARGAFLPTIDYEGSWTHTQFSTVNLGIPFTNDLRLVKLGFNTSLLLFDFGGRNAHVQMASASLHEANWLYNWEVQTVMIETVRCFYDYTRSVAIKEASAALVEDYEHTLNAARALRKSGIHSIADELQAQTQLTRARIDLERDIGIQNITQATLIRSLGIPADQHIEVSPLPERIPHDKVSQTVEQLVKLAKDQRADLKAVRASVMRSRADITASRSDMLPTVGSKFQFSRASLEELRFLDNYLFQFDLKVPLLHGFEKVNALRASQAKLLESQAHLDNRELNAFLTVMSDYYEYLANSEILDHSHSYVKVAEENQKVALANYEMGLNSILEVMVSNNALNTARKQLIDAKTNFLTSLANLSYHTGGLKPQALPNKNEIPIQTVHDVVHNP